MKDLKAKTVRGGVAKAVSQAASFVLRIGSLALLARLLVPEEFGLVNMVTAVTGILMVLRDAGLTLATIQRPTLTADELSAIFWLNLGVGLLLSSVCLALAPILASFYNESRLLGVTAALAPAFFISALGAQHGALLGRELRFIASSVIDVISILLGSVIAIAMAFAGYGYWSLIAMALAIPAATSAGNWLAVRWTPGLPSRRTKVGSLLRFGGTVTLNGLIVYVAFNVEKVLLGRFWGADALGLYGRAYQLVNIPTENLNSAVGGVALSALSRVQDDPARIKSYFLKGYSLVLALTVPATLACALFADEIVLVVLGPKWSSAASLVRLLAPTILVFGLINPMFWLLFALAKLARSLYIALVIAPLVIVAYVIGLPHGPAGVALCYSAAMLLWLIPHLLWCTRGTPVAPSDLLRAVRDPLLSGAAAGAITLAFLIWVREWSPYARIVVGGGILVGTYAVALLYVMRQKAFYVDLLRSLRQARAGE